MKRRAFSLVELLVVISILSILSALLFPVFVRAKESARDTVCLSGLRQIGVATSLYQADSDDRMPYAVSAQTKVVAQQTPPEERQALFQKAINLPSINLLLEEYGAVSEIWRCPEDQVESIFLSENDALPPALQWKPTYFQTFGSSYDYDDVTAVLRGGVEELASSDAIIFCDYPPVHGPRSSTKAGDRNLLLGDCHVQLDTRDRWATSFVRTNSGEWQ